MTTRFIIKALILVLLFGCKGKAIGNHDAQSLTNEISDRYEKNISNDDDSYPDDTYCAEVKYHNPRTGTQSSCTLTIKVESNQIVQINWPNGGRLDENNFSNALLDEEGHSSFESEKGYEYDVQIIGKSDGCFNNVPMVSQCRGITKNGNRCKHMTDNPNQLCWQHQNQE